MAANLVGAVLRLRDIDPTEKLALVSLAYHCNTKTLRCDPSIPLIAEEAEISERQVYRILGSLVKRRLLIRQSGRGFGHRNQYGFPAMLLSGQQPTLWDEKPDIHDTFKAEQKVTSQGGQPLTPMSGGDDTRVRGKGKERERKGSIPYGRLNAAAAYRQALVDLPQNGNHQAQVAVLVDFTRAHCPTATVPGRLAALVRDYAAEDVLAVLWQAIPKDRPLDYAQATLRNKASGQRGPPPQPDFSEYERVSRQGKGHEEEK